MTTFAEQINFLATRAGTECKTLHTKIGELTSLTTTDKTSVIKAVNEVKTATSTLQTSLNGLTARVGTVEGSASTNTGNISTIQGQISMLQQTVSQVESAIKAIEGQIESQTNINDGTPSNTTTYSSNKIEAVVTAAKTAVKNDLLGGAGTAYDTLKELADLIQTNGSAIDSLEALAAGHVRFDAAQELDDNKKTQARSNIGAASQTKLTSVNDTANQAKTTADQATSALAALKTSLGNLSTDFVAAFESALETQVTGLR